MSDMPGSDTPYTACLLPHLSYTPFLSHPCHPPSHVTHHPSPPPNLSSSGIPEEEPAEVTSCGSTGAEPAGVDPTLVGLARLGQALIGGPSSLQPKHFNRRGKKRVVDSIYSHNKAVVKLLASVYNGAPHALVTVNYTQTELSSLEIRPSHEEIIQ